MVAAGLQGADMPPVGDVRSWLWLPAAALRQEAPVTGIFNRRRYNNGGREPALTGMGDQ